MKFKEYEMPDGKKAVFEYDENGVGKITLECMDMLMGLINNRKTENSSEKANKSKVSEKLTGSTRSKMEQVEPQTCSFSDCDNFKNPNYERCIECKRKQIKLKTEQKERVMTNAQKFQETFGIYATEMWAMPEHDFLKWLNADTSQTEETCERCVYVRGSQWCQGCNGTPKRWDGEKIVDTPQTESTGSPIGDYRDGVGAWQTDRMTEEEIDTMLAKALVGQTDCEACELDGKADVCKICRTSNYEPQTDCGWK